MPDEHEDAEDQPDESSWENILDDVLGGPDEDESVTQAITLGPVRAKVRPDEIELAMVREEGLGPESTGALPVAPAVEDAVDVQRLLHKGRTATTVTARKSIASVFQNLSEVIPSKPKRRVSGIHPRQMLQSMRGFRRWPKRIKVGFGKFIDYLLRRAMTLSETLHASGLKWKDLVGIAGILLILAVALNYFSPELRTLFGI